MNKLDKKIYSTVSLFRSLMLLPALFLGVAEQGHAASTWQGNKTVASYRIHYGLDVSDAILEITVKESIDTGCSSADTNKTFSVWDNTAGTQGISDYQKTMMSQAATALAMGAKVNVLIWGCDSATGRANIRWIDVLAP